jgi:excisionase family DNA binding protein
LGGCVCEAVIVYSKQSINTYIAGKIKMAVVSNKKIAVKTEEYGENKLPARLLAVGEVAHFLGVHSSTVRRWEKKGLLKSYAIGLRHSLRFKQEDVLLFLSKCRKKSTGSD